MNSEVKKYYKEIYHLFPAHRKKEKLYLQQLKKQIFEISYENKNMSYQECVDEFGSPKDIVITYYQTLDNQELINDLNRRKLIKIVISIIILSIISALLFYVYDLSKSYEAWKDNLPFYDDIITEEYLDE